MIKNYIFDFGNVLAEFNPEKLTAPYVEDEEIKKRISEVVFDRLYWDKLDDGTITDDQVKEKIRSRLFGDEADVACRVYDNWVNSLSPVENMQQLIFDMKKSGERLFLLSNISKGFKDAYVEVEWINELLDGFEGIILSGPIGKIKPNRDIYEYLLKTFNLKAEECLFIDDSKKNIDGAALVGINGYLFDGDAKKLREFIGK